MRLYASLCVLRGPICLNASFMILLRPYDSLWVVVGSYVSLCVFMGPCKSLCVVMDSYESL